MQLRYALRCTKHNLAGVGIFLTDRRDLRNYVLSIHRSIVHSKFTHIARLKFTSQRIFEATTLKYMGLNSQSNIVDIPGSANLVPSQAQYTWIKLARLSGDLTEMNLQNFAWRILEAL